MDIRKQSDLKIIGVVFLILCVIVNSFLISEGAKDDTYLDYSNPLNENGIVYYEVRCEDGGINPYMKNIISYKNVVSTELFPIKKAKIYGNYIILVRYLERGNQGRKFKQIQVYTLSGEKQIECEVQFSAFNAIEYIYILNDSIAYINQHPTCVYLFGGKEVKTYLMSKDRYLDVPEPQTANEELECSIEDNRCLVHCNNELVLVID